jgi:hypothetical protein
MKIDDKVLTVVAQAILNEWLASKAQDDLLVSELYWSDKDLYMAQAQAAITAYLKETQGWKPIKEAPKNGTEIILMVKLCWNREALENKEPRVGVGFYVAGAYWYDENCDVWRNRVGQFLENTNVKYWQPFSPAPEADLIASIEQGE